MPKNSRYLYKGPHTAVTLIVTDSQGMQVDSEAILWSGRGVDLPSDHEYVQALVRSGCLTALPGVGATVKAKSTKAATTEQSQPAA